MACPTSSDRLSSSRPSAHSPTPAGHPLVPLLQRQAPLATLTSGSQMASTVLPEGIQEAAQGPTGQQHPLLQPAIASSRARGSTARTACHTRSSNRSHHSSHSISSSSHSLLAATAVAATALPVLASLMEAAPLTQAAAARPWASSKAAMGTCKA